MHMLVENVKTHWALHMERPMGTVRSEVPSSLGALLLTIPSPTGLSFYNILVILFMWKIKHGYGYIHNLHPPFKSGQKKFFFFLRFYMDIAHGIVCMDRIYVVYEYYIQINRSIWILHMNML
jgi:hypothetical protein